MKAWKKAYVLLMALFLSGCAPKVSDELIEYIKSVREKKTPYQEDLPAFPKFSALKYNASTFRDPFMPYEIQESGVALSAIPDIKRKREPLEIYPLETLIMVGTIEQAGAFYALLKDQTGMVHYVGVGNYIGQNSGRIESISVSEINIKQLGPDNRGGWREFPVTIYLKKAVDAKEKSSKNTP